MPLYILLPLLLFWVLFAGLSGCIHASYSLGNYRNLDIWVDDLFFGIFVGTLLGPIALLLMIVATEGAEHGVRFWKLL